MTSKEGLAPGLSRLARASVSLGSMTKLGTVGWGSISVCLLTYCARPQPLFPLQLQETGVGTADRATSGLSMGLRLDPDPAKRIRQLGGEGSWGLEDKEASRAMQAA